MAGRVTTIKAVFVYGTLKRGQCREGMWPAVPNRIDAGWVLGELHSRDDYPALLGGEKRVAGERWEFRPEQMPRVLGVLDEIEGTSGNSPSDLYHRRIVDVWSADGNELGAAYTYFYNRDPVADGFRGVGTASGYQSWPDWVSD